MSGPMAGFLFFIAILEWRRVRLQKRAWRDLRNRSLSSTSLSTEEGASRTREHSGGAGVAPLSMVQMAMRALGRFHKAVHCLMLTLFVQRAHYLIAGGGGKGDNVDDLIALETR